MVSTEESMCRCERCSSYPECGAENFLLVFCRRDKAPCGVTVRGCQCRLCKVQEMYGFTHEYYCMQGAEKSRF